MVDARIERVEHTAVAFIEMHGSYARMGEAFGTLYRWIADNGLSPEGMPRGVFLTDPADTPEEDAVWEVQAPVAGDPIDQLDEEKSCGVKHIGPHMEVWTVFRGPYRSLEPTYGDLTQWIAGHGYAISGPPMEVYLSDPADTDPADYVTEVRFPVRAT